MLQPTLVLSPTHSEDSLALELAAYASGWSVVRLESWRVPETLIDLPDLVLFGEALFVRTIADALSYSLLEAPRSWLASLPAETLKRSIQIMKLGDAESIVVPSFIKPAGDKAFEARVYESGVSFLSTVSDLSRNIDLIVSVPVTWQLEYRCFVLDRQVRTVACYWKDGEATKSSEGWPTISQHDAQALEFATQVLRNTTIDCPPAFVMDIGLIQDRGWAVLEANPAWASGVYGCSPDAVLSVVRRACIPSSELPDSDRQWVPAWESWYDDGG
jgi:hypothetical protein